MNTANEQSKCSCNICELERDTATNTEFLTDDFKLELEKKLHEPIYSVGMECDWRRYQLYQFFETNTNPYIEHITSISDEDFTNSRIQDDKSDDINFLKALIYEVKNNCLDEYEQTIVAVSCLNAYEVVFLGYAIFLTKFNNAIYALRTTGSSSELLSLSNYKYSTNDLYNLAIKFKNEYTQKQEILDSLLNSANVESGFEALKVHLS